MTMRVDGSVDAKGTLCCLRCAGKSGRQRFSLRLGSPDG